MADDGHGGKIPGKIKDALPVVPDKVVEALEKGKDVPLEALVSPAVAEQFQDEQARRKEPVRMDTLTAVAPGDPRVQMNFNDGAVLPRAPQVRRVIPAPYRRPRIAVDHHGKTWQNVRADGVRVGDIITGIGLVQEIAEIVRREQVAGIPDVATGIDIHITGPENTMQLDSGADVRVFRRS